MGIHRQKKKKNKNFCKNSTNLKYFGGLKTEMKIKSS